MIKFLSLLLEAVPVLYRTWQELERSRRDEAIKDDVYSAWSDKFGQLHDAKANGQSDSGLPKSDPSSDEK